ncbi:hypothetical protein SUNI508_08616 [Seiridium unicorne]|uniref:Uncharacterized protein n=1 Tax=Seiridium unicorne TaxID=138068 RepID=A0ABR2UTI1_9PEZI
MLTVNPGALPEKTGMELPTCVWGTGDMNSSRGRATKV